MTSLTKVQEDRHSDPSAPVSETSSASRTGLLIINADDWGRDLETTNRTVECFLRGAVSSVSAMVFMEDSDRAAAMSREHGIDAGLHLNFTTPFSAPGTPARLIEHQQRVARHLGRHRFASAVFHPRLRESFKYVVTAQIDEFRRLFGFEPQRIDGHHHMHLCANVVFGKLLPAGTIVRRNFSFHAGDKSLANRFYRRVIDRRLAKTHRMTDFFFSLAPIERHRLENIVSHATESVVELETHPVRPEEFRFLMKGEIGSWSRASQIATHFVAGNMFPHAI